MDVLWRRWRLATVTAVTVFAAAAAFLLGLPDLYRATATVLVEGAAPVVGDSAPAANGVDARLQVIKEEALSRARLTDLVDRFHLYPASVARGPIDAVLARLQGDIALKSTSTDVNGQSETIAFALSYVGRTPGEAAAVTNALASFFVDRNDRLRAQQTSRATEVLTAEAAQTKKQLDDTGARLRSYTAENMGALPQQVDANLAALQRLNEQLRLNTDDEMKLTERRETLENQIADLGVKPPEDPNAPAAQLVQLKRQLADLLTRETDRYPDVKALKDQIAALERQTAHEASPANAASASASPAVALKAALAETETEIRRLDAENATLRSSMKNYEGRVERAPGNVPEFQALTRDYEATRDQYDGLQKRLTDAHLAERAESGGASGERFRILDAADPPASAAGLNRWYLLALILVAALAAGIGAAILADRFDTSFHSVAELRAFTRVPVLTSIPPIPTPGDSARHVARAFVATATYAVTLTGLGLLAFHVAHSSVGVARLLLQIG